MIRMGTAPCQTCGAGLKIPRDSLLMRGCQILCDVVPLSERLLQAAVVLDGFLDGVEDEAKSAKRCVDSNELRSYPQGEIWRPCASISGP